MTVQEFIEEFKDIIQADEEIIPSNILADMEEWDSMAIMACMAWFDMKLSVKLTYNDFLPVKTVQDIINLSQGKIA